MKQLAPTYGQHLHVSTRSCPISPTRGQCSSMSDQHQHQAFPLLWIITSSIQRRYIPPQPLPATVHFLHRKTIPKRAAYSISTLFIFLLNIAQSSFQPYVFIKNSAKVTNGLTLPFQIVNSYQTQTISFIWHDWPLTSPWNALFIHLQGITRFTSQLTSYSFSSSFTGTSSFSWLMSHGVSKDPFIWSLFLFTYWYIHPSKCWHSTTIHFL